MGARLFAESAKKLDALALNGREGETATLYERRSLNPKLRVFGFAPRHLNR